MGNSSAVIWEDPDSAGKAGVNTANTLSLQLFT
jgi:hypothetical protein